MKRIRISLLLIIGAAITAGVYVAGCDKPSATVPTSPVGFAIPTRAQARLPTIKLWLGAQEMITELALTPSQWESGMMFRTNMAENEGMIFVFPVPQRTSFWMKNTLLPLSAAYIAPNGTILEIHDLQPQDTNSVVASSDNVLYVLETPQGWFKRHDLKEGTLVTTEKGPLAKVFRR
jgi:uncharacterized membrane protein (UPF0127 family)